MDVANVLAAHGVGEAIGNAAVGDVRAGKKFSTTALIGSTGTLADNGNGSTHTPTTTDITLAAGIWDSANIIQGDANLVPANIKNGVSIFGVTGTALQYVSGTASFDATGKLQVTGLPFTPSRVFIDSSGGPNGQCLFDSQESTTQYMVNGGYGSSVTYTVSGGSFTIQATTTYANVSQQHWTALQ